MVKMLTTKLTDGVWNFPPTKAADCLSQLADFKDIPITATASISVLVTSSTTPAAKHVTLLMPHCLQMHQLLTR